MSEEYIRRSAAKEELCSRCYDSALCYRSDDDCPIKRGLNSIPAADVVEVVRCRDCKHYDDADGDMKCVKDADWDEETAHYYGFVAYHNPDWFCADGERRAE